MSATVLQNASHHNHLLLTSTDARHVPLMVLYKSDFSFYPHPPPPTRNEADDYSGLCGPGPAALAYMLHQGRATFCQTIKARNAH